jgi:Arc/MetJ-type ribon-helix-helix transcriptional regulator
MALQISPRIQAQIVEMVARGDYPDADSMLEEALELLSERERLVELKAMIAVGVEEVAQGKVVEFTPELRETLWQSAVDQAAEERSQSPNAHT